MVGEDRLIDVCECAICLVGKVLIVLEVVVPFERIWRAINHLWYWGVSRKMLFGD